MLEEKEISYIFVKYVYSALTNQANKYYKNSEKQSVPLNYEENYTESELWKMNLYDLELIESPLKILELKEKMSEINEHFNELTMQEKSILFEKYINQKSDYEIGQEYSLTSQAISKKESCLKKTKKQPVTKMISSNCMNYTFRRNNMENLVPLIRKAKEGDQESLVSLQSQFDLLIRKLSKRNSFTIDEDCYQELYLRFYIALEKFDINRYLK